MEEKQDEKVVQLNDIYHKKLDDILSSGNDEVIRAVKLMIAAHSKTVNVDKRLDRLEEGIDRVKEQLALLRNEGGKETVGARTLELVP